MNVLIKSPLVLTVTYSVGHIIIAILCSYYILDAKINLAAIDAFVEPGINAFWFYLLQKIVKN